MQVGCRLLNRSPKGVVPTPEGLALSRRADANSRDLAGNTVLMGAAFKGHVEMFRRLLAAGADAAAKNEGGMDARQFAVMFGRVEIVKELDAALPAAA